MNRLTALLEGLYGEADFPRDGAFIDDRILNSLDIVTLVTDINDAYGIEIGAEDISRENFNSLDGIASLIRRRGGELCP